MRVLLSFLLVTTPLLPVLAGLFARRLPGQAAGAWAVGAAAAALVQALLLVGVLASSGPITLTLLSGLGSGDPISLRLDAISAVMVVLVSFLGLTVLRFARAYVAGDPREARFFSWLSLTLGAVLLLVLAGHLALLLAAWVATSLCLHQLLLHYPERAGAVFSARKKFVVSRAGDACLLAALVLLYAHYGTGDLASLFAAAATGDTAPLPAAGLLLALCAALKSAQFPFHSWLPDTMETPTPVSAFMHAGIINAGGFLVIRLSPLFQHAPAALALLAILGALTAAFGAVVMLAQPTVKRALAYSTVAQMGFMLLQCGLGAFALALLHLVAHALYKAHAFLHAGSTIGALPRAAIPLRNRALAMGVLTSGLVVAGAATALALWAPKLPLHLAFFGLVLALALAYGVARVGSSGGGRRTWIGGTVAAVGVALASFALHGTATLAFDSLPRVTPAPALVAFAGTIFVALFVGQTLLWRTGHHAWARQLYVHALNGFYVGTVANRLLNRLWPRPTY